MTVAGPKVAVRGGGPVSHRFQPLAKLVKFAELMRKFTLTTLAILMAALLCFSCRRGGAASVTEEAVVDSIPPLGFWTDSLLMTCGAVRGGETFTGLMNRLGMDSERAYLLAAKCDSVFDVRRMRAGNSYEAYYDADTAQFRSLEYVVYHNDRIRMTVFRCGGDSLAVWRVEKPVEITLELAEVTITHSLWQDMDDAGIPTALISGLSQIYAWTIDFFGLQAGDEFRVLYGQKLVDGEVVAIDSIYYAVFTSGEKTLPAIMLDAGGGGGLYWNEKGESMRKAFLKAPLEFSRISSGFSYHRRHPVTGQVRAHTGVDYAAPTGTPVVSIGDGVVVSAGWAGGGGNQVKIRHNSVYQTAYLHLSRFASGIKAGARVRQGDVIGYVGSTGVSTGPHLDFRVWENGTPVNPLTLDSPSDEPLAEDKLPLLDSLHATYRHIADSLGRLEGGK